MFGLDTMITTTMVRGDGLTVVARRSCTENVATLRRVAGMKQTNLPVVCA